MIHICWHTADVLDQIAELPAPGPLPRRTIVVPRPRVAHGLRTGLIQRGRLDLLAGTAFVTVKALATEVLQAAGVRYREGENELRLSRLRVLYGRELDPEYFARDLVRSTPGWEEALARTIGELERGGVTVADLSGVDTPLVRGLAQVWRALGQHAGPSLTRAGMVGRAATELESNPGLAGDWGTVLALVTGYADGVEARLVQAIPDVHLALRAVRPLRDEYLERVEALFGPAAARALAEAAPEREGGTDLQVLGRYLFESPELQSQPARVRAGAEPDGTVALEEHAGVAAEIEAAADWVARQVLEHATPLDQIAVLVPRLDPLAQLVADRLRRLPWEGAFPVHVSGGVPLVSVSEGGRILAVVEALRGHLSTDDMARVLPLLRPASDGQPIAQGAAVDLAQSLGTVGGSAAHPEGALEWPDRVAARQEALQSLVDRAKQAEGDEEQAGLARGLRETERLLRDLETVRPALEGLVAVARAVTEGATLPVVWPLLGAFVRQWVLPREDAPTLAQLSDSMRPACEDAQCSELAGGEALSLVEATLRGLRVPVGRFGEPAVYVGTVSGATGLSFEAVRVVGLVDGSIPASPHEDTVLPDELRQRVGQRRVTTAADAALRSLHELYQIVQDTGRKLVLSTPRLALSRSYREPSSLFLEVATALGRPTRDASAHAGVPSLDEIREREFGPSRVRAAAFRRANPIGEAAWQDRAAEDRARQQAPEVPSAWLAGGALSLARMSELQRPDEAAAMEGILGVDAEGPAIPGLGPRRPLSASRWRTFLSCPHRFLYEHLLAWEEPAGPASQRELGALAYGSLFHRVLERFYAANGRQFWGRQGSLDQYQQTVAAIAARQFAEVLEQYPLAGEAVRRQQLGRLQREVRDFVEYLWGQGPSRFVAAEQAFGYDQPVALPAGPAPLHVRGFIDLIDVDGPTTRIWDVKTGRCHPRQGSEAPACPTLDAQLALYALVARQLAGQWGATDRLRAAYAYTNDRRGRLREFGPDFADLEAAGRRWLEVTAALMRERSFPRTPDSNDCTYCPYLPVCGEEATQRTPARQGAGGALQAFAEIRE